MNRERLAKLDVEIIARICHEANRAYCAALDDHSHLAWDEAPQWQKESAIAGVKFHIANPHATPKDSHDAWLKQKLRTGWTYGFIKDEAKKEHPCLKPYHELPRDQKRKDALFASIAAALSNEDEISR